MFNKNDNFVVVVVVSFEFCNRLKTLTHFLFQIPIAVLNKISLYFLFMQRPTQEELQKIVSFSQKNSDAVLDRPEQFLLDLSRISCYEERLYCMMFKTTVSDSLSEIGQKLTNFRLVCEVSTVHVFVFKKVMLNHQQINS